MMPDLEAEKKNSKRDFINNLRRLANALEDGSTIVIVVNGQRIRVPNDAETSIEYERFENGEELEFQLTWKQN